MHIVVLDGFTLNPGDLNWNELRALGSCDIYERTAPGQLLERAAKAQVLLTNKTPITKAHLEQLSDLRYIGVLATGTNVVDIPAASARGIVVTNVPAYGTASVAQATLALLLELTNHAGHHSQTVRDGRWSKNPDWCYWDYPLVELAGLTMGIVGFGRIGAAVAKLAAAFGMKILAPTPNSRPLPDWAEKVELDQLFRSSDVVSLHCPLTPETKNLVNTERLGLMKPTAFLLNTSRGGLVDEQALALALNTGRLAGAALDVLTTEPPPMNHPLFTARNCLITPHQAWATKAARARLMKMAVENLRAFASGTPRNLVGLGSSQTLHLPPS